MTKLAVLVEASDAVAATSSRKAKVERLGALLAALEPPEVGIAVSFLTGALTQGRIGLGPATLREAHPDAAAAAATLSLRDVDDAFARIAAVSGKGSTDEKVRQLRDLLARATADEQSFLRRLVFGDLRQGALEGVMAEAIARAANVPLAAVRRGLLARGDLAEVAKVALAEGEAGLSRFRVQLFRPLPPMLASPAADADEAIERLGQAALEYKLDGARIQVHRAGDDVRVFSRALNDVTAAVPEIVEVVRALPAKELVLDGEALALRPDGSPHPFQITMRRFGRRLDVDAMRRELPLTPFLFDLLRLDGTDLFDEPQSRRAGALAELLPEALRVPSALASSAQGVDEFFAQALRRGHEGIMAKSREAPYDAGARGFAWLKLKPAHTLDLVILAAEWGSGRRKGWLSNLHLGARDPANGGFVMLGKTFKGLTDEMLAWQTEKLLSLEIGRDDWTVHVKPELVVEIAFSDVQTSPQYPGGLALRFARVRRYRTDKTSAETDTIDAVREIHRRSTGA
ncbi:MAG: ATP-dependent DNA ligase [bacterium]